MVKEVVVKIAPQDVEPEEFEDLLATDDLFVEYFNAFLALPTFPEPLLFNKETGGFEILTDEKQKLAEEIKAAVRAGRKRKKIYRHVRNNAFTPIPLITIEEPPLVEEKEIDTSFSVQTLNKEQGIEWVKVERLPLFLESDCYMEYRLAWLVSQAQVSVRPGEYISMRIDYTSHAKEEEVEEPVTVEEETEDKEFESLMKDMYVSLGNTSTTDVETWVSHAKMAHGPVTTSSSEPSQSRPVSSIMVSSASQGGGSRPISAFSSAESCLRVDSGVWSSTSKPSVETTSSISDHESDHQRVGKVFNANMKAHAPRPSDTMFLMAEGYDARSLLPKSPVYCKPPSEPPTPSSPTGHQPENDNSVMNIAERTDSGFEDSSSIQTIEELGATIVGTALKNALAELTGGKPDQVENSSSINSNKSIDTFDKQECRTEQTREASLDQRTISPEISKNGCKSDTVQGKQSQKKESPRESDEDSLLNSDDDYDQERDDFFRRHKVKQKVALGTKKGIEEFKHFLCGTTGEKNWSFWLDVDRLWQMKESGQIVNYMAALRERYHKHGTRLELSTETKLELGLVEPTQWTKDKVLKVQDRMAEPLVLYWAPRFLLRQDLKPRPETNLLYRNQCKLRLPSDSHPSPSPPVALLLPLRPKTCIPRFLNHQKHQEMEISPAFDISTQQPRRPNTSCDVNLSTSPVIGMRRVHSTLETLNGNSEKDKINQERQNRKKRPKELITALLQLEKNDTKQDSPDSLKKNRSHFKPVVDAWVTSSTVSSVSTHDGAGRKPASHSAPSKSHPGSRPGSRSGSRPGSAVSLADSTNLSEISEFAGGRRMEGLLQALHNDRKAGEAFRKFLSKQDNQTWQNSLKFWKDVQEFHSMFYREILNIFVLEKKSKSVYSQYVVEGAPYPINCCQNIKESIHSRLEPPFEDLFDPAEEYVLEVLFEAWSQMLVTDLSTFDKVELIEVKRRLDAKSKYVVSLQRRGIIKDQGEEDQDPMEGYQDPVYDPSLMDKIPEEFKDYTLGKLIHNRLELEHFRTFLADNYASMDLMCWMDVETFKRIPHTEELKRDGKARDIKAKYLTKKYFFGPNSPAGKEGQDKIVTSGGGWGKMLDDRPATIVIMEVQNYVGDRLEKKWLPLFLTTPEFAERQNPKVGMDDAVEDILIQRKKKSHAIWKMLESKWVSSSQDIFTFRKALINPVSSMQFRKFVSIRGDNYENDVLFWQEVQKYKELCHLHADRNLIQQKTFAIIHCFIDSPIPPALQIDITQDMAELILQRKNETAPYLFREAQLMVFRVLFQQWTEFCSFRDNITKDKIIPTLERHKRRARFEDKKKKRVLEQRRAKEEARRKALGLPPESTDDSEYDPFREESEEEIERQMRVNRDAVGWSYSHYMQALQEEEVLNEVDHSTFSSVAAARSDVFSPFDLETDGSTTGSRPINDLNKVERKEPKKPAKLDMKGGSEISSRCNSAGRPRSGQGLRQAEPQPPIKPKDLPKPESQIDRMIQRVERRVSSGPGQRLLMAKPPEEPNKDRPRLARRMPPLVSRK